MTTSYKTPIQNAFSFLRLCAINTPGCKNTLGVQFCLRKELVFLLFVCLSENSFVVFNVFSFSPDVYVGTLNLFALIAGPSILF